MSCSLNPVSVRSFIPLLSYAVKVMVAFMVHFLLFAIDGRTIRIDQYLPIHLGECLCRLLRPGLIMEGETVYNVDVLDFWLFWGLLLLPLYFFLLGRNVAIGHICLNIPLLAMFIWVITI